jgi:Methylene-tetrahydrofolate reductase C terminal
MLRSKQKPFEEILGYLEGDSRVFVLGCDGCAQASGTGGPLQVAEMKEKLEAAGKTVTGTDVVGFLCEKALVRSRLAPKTRQVMEADSVLVLTCGVGIQATAASINKQCHPGCDTQNLGGSRGEWQGSERCVECAECVLEWTGGICPLTACTKHLLSGQCGGASKGKCELAPEKDCGWELIYHRLKAIGQLDNLKRVPPPKSWGKMAPDVHILGTDEYALESPEMEEAKTE